MLTAPGLDWNYSGGSAELLGAVLRKVTGKPIDAFARDALFEPLKITDVELARHADGSPSASGGLRMRSRDIAKIGQLVAARGLWDGREIVPGRWIDDSIAPQIGAADRLYFYGYHWWLGRSLVCRKEFTWAAVVGLGGQRIYVVPSLELVDHCRSLFGRHAGLAASRHLDTCCPRSRTSSKLVLLVGCPGRRHR
jgi:CubicO group peptidase (beta-lactamase class C family)